MEKVTMLVLETISYCPSEGCSITEGVFHTEVSEGLGHAVSELSAKADIQVEVPAMVIYLEELGYAGDYYYTFKLFKAVKVDGVLYCNAEQALK